MFKSMERNKLGTRIVLGIFVGMIGIGMLLYLVPSQAGTAATGVDVVATVDGQPVTRTEVQAQLQKIQQGQQIPAALAPLYAQQIIEQLVFEKELEVEAHAPRRRQFLMPSLPTASSCCFPPLSRTD